MTVAMLKSHCKDFGLSQSGNKSVLRERLEAFSRDRDAWERCVSCPVGVLVFSPVDADLCASFPFQAPSRCPQVPQGLSGQHDDGQDDPREAVGAAPRTAAGHCHQWDLDRD